MEKEEKIPNTNVESQKEPNKTETRKPDKKKSKVKKLW